MLAVQQLMSALLAPLPIAQVLLLAAFVLLLAGWRRSGLGGMAVALAWLWIWSLPVVADQVGAGLEFRYPALAADSPQLPRADVIVVAGGVFGTGLALPHPNLNSAADRYWHAARLFHAGKAPWIIVSGGGRPGSAPPTEAASARLFLLDLGVPDERILLEDQARTTRENAVRVQAMVHEYGFQNLLLVTSALHMRRTEASFRALGMDIVPVATDYEVSTSSWAEDDDSGRLRRWLPSSRSLFRNHQAWHEHVGYWYYRLRGWL